ncbi:MAG: hypothetical protein EXR77_19640 [Myxococcales bacterium]|nr:hypothetical protein [Myxococcales bacterium]
MQAHQVRLLDAGGGPDRGLRCAQASGYSRLDSRRAGFGHRHASWLLALALAQLAGCAAEPAPPAPEPAETIDGPAAALGAAALGGSVTALIAIKLLTSTLVAENTTLDPKASAGQLADAIHAHALKAKSGCSGLAAFHVPSTATINITLPSNTCKISGFQASGLVDLTLATADGVATCTVKLGAVKVRGQEFVGTVKLHMAADKTLTTEVVDLQIGKTTLSWLGNPATDANGVGLTVDGTGTIKQAADGPTIGVAMVAVRRNFAACYPHSGTITVTQPLPLIAPKAKVGTVVDTVISLAFDGETPRDGSVEATVTAGKLKPTVYSNMTLPLYGDCPDGTAP